MPSPLFSARYAVTHENRTGSNTYACTLVFFDDLTCTREITHRMYDCEPPFGADSTDSTTYTGRWHVTPVLTADPPDFLLHIEEQGDQTEYTSMSGHPGNYEETTQGSRTPESIRPITVEVRPLLEGYIIGQHTGAPARIQGDRDDASAARRHTEGDAAAFLAFLQHHAAPK